MGVTHPEGCRCPGCLPGQYVMRPARPPAPRPARVPPGRQPGQNGGGGIGILIPVFLAFLFACWPFIVWHGCKYGDAPCSGSDWVWNGQTWTACGIWWGILVSPFLIAGIAGAQRKRALRPPKGRLRVEATQRPVSSLPPPPPSICVQPPACQHLGAVKVENLINPAAPPWAYLCPECNEQLPEEFGRLMRPCCGTPPGERHLYNCPQAARG